MVRESVTHRHAQEGTEASPSLDTYSAGTCDNQLRHGDRHPVEDHPAVEGLKRQRFVLNPEIERTGTGTTAGALNGLKTKRITPGLVRPVHLNSLSRRRLPEECHLMTTFRIKLDLEIRHTVRIDRICRDARATMEVPGRVPSTHPEVVLR